MALSITTTIHSIDTEEKLCFVTIKDGPDFILDNKNIGLELSPDGSANNKWIQSMVSAHIVEYRKQTNRQQNAKISVSMGGDSS